MLVIGVMLHNNRQSGPIEGIFADHNDDSLTVCGFERYRHPRRYSNGVPFDIELVGALRHDPPFLLNACHDRIDHPSHKCRRRPKQRRIHPIAAAFEVAFSVRYRASPFLLFLLFGPQHLFLHRRRQREMETNMTATTAAASHRLHPLSGYPVVCSPDWFI